MKKTLALCLLACGATLVAALNANAAKVDVSLNAFPTNLANPNGGGTFTIFAKTDTPFGIAAINLYLSNVAKPGLTVEPDINDLSHGGMIFATAVTGGLNVLYGQDTSSGTLVFGVGTAATSDGPDALGNPAWNGATKIFAGVYGGALPAFITSGANSSAANVFTQTGTTPLPAGAVVAAMMTTTVVRVAGVPEPATIVAGLSAMVGIALLRRRR